MRLGGMIMGDALQRQWLSVLVAGSLLAGFGAATLLHALYASRLYSSHVQLAPWTLPAAAMLLVIGAGGMWVGWHMRGEPPSVLSSSPPRAAPQWDVHKNEGHPAQPNTLPESNSVQPRTVRCPGETFAKEGFSAEDTATEDTAAEEFTAEQPRRDAPYVSRGDTPLKIVAIGGGTGMPQLLRGLRTHTDAISAIVTVADDGGSSGRLRRQMGLLPPGDFRNNIAALSESEDLLTRLFQYRFASPTGADNGQGEVRSELAGHSFGNLFIATMAAVTGSFESGLAESSRVLAVRGRVLPSTLEQVHLCAEVRRTTGTGEDATEEWLQVEGESQIPEAGGQIMRVFLKPAEVRAYPEAIRAILQADLIVAGPGSFFTSIMPNLLVPAVRDAIIASRAPSIYLCNVATQPGETDGYAVSDHMAQLRRHAGDAFTTVLANHTYSPGEPLSSKSQWVTLPAGAHPNQQVDGMHISERSQGISVAYQLFTGDLVDEERPWRHNPQKVAARLVEVGKNIVS